MLPNVSKAGDPRSAVLRQMLLLRHRMAFLINALQYHIQVDVIDANFSALVARLDPDPTSSTGDSHRSVPYSTSTPFTTSPTQRGSPMGSPRNNNNNKSPKAKAKAKAKAADTNGTGTGNGNGGVKAGDTRNTGDVSTGSITGDYLAIERAHEAFLANIVKGCFMQVKVIQKGLDDVFRTCSEFCFLLENSPNLAAIDPARIREYVFAGSVLCCVGLPHLPFCMAMQLCGYCVRTLNGWMDGFLPFCPPAPHVFV